MVLDALESKERDEWPDEVARQRSDISINEEASRIWSEASFNAVDHAMQRRDRVSTLASSEDLASTRRWDEGRDLAKYDATQPPPTATDVSMLSSVAADYGTYTRNPYHDLINVQGHV